MRSDFEIVPGFGAFAEAAADHDVIPVTSERLADLLTPVGAYLKLVDTVRRPFLLESAEGGEHIGRYSYLGGDPFLEVRGDAEGLVLRPDDGSERRLEGDPVALLDGIHGRYRPQRRAGVPPFAGGGVGYVGYEAVRWVERLPSRDEDEAPLPWLHLAFYDTLLAFDHLRHRVVLIANGRVADPGDRSAVREAYDDAVDRLHRLAEILDGPAAPAAPLEVANGADAVDLDLEESLDEAGFGAAVRQAQERILAGDAFQIVLSRRLACRSRAEPITVYRALRAINPSPYMFCLDTGEAQIVGSSPEMQVRVRDSMVETRPIAGTRRRGADAVEDEELERELLADDKERAEHLMLVDLGRNDLGRVARFGSVEVPEFMAVERYSHVMHIVSAVTARLRDGVGSMEALFATFPAGTVSGAPKIRAMEIIQGLEPAPRGVYAGAVLYSDFAGNLNSCIAIRTIVMKNGRARVQAGAGIVADSQPEREYRETEEKAAAPLQALRWAEAATTAAVDAPDVPGDGAAGTGAKAAGTRRPGRGAN